MHHESGAMSPSLPVVYLSRGRVGLDQVLQRKVQRGKNLQESEIPVQAEDQSERTLRQSQVQRQRRSCQGDVLLSQGVQIQKE